MEKDAIWLLWTPPRNNYFRVKRSVPTAHQAPYTIFIENNTSVFFVDMPSKINQKKTIKIEILGARSVSGQNINEIQLNFLKYQAVLKPNFMFGAHASSKI